MTMKHTGKWLKSNITQNYHYHGKKPDSYEGDNSYVSKCRIHKISAFHYETKSKYEILDIPRPDKICKKCLDVVNIKLDFMNYLIDIEELIDEIMTPIDFISKIIDLELITN